MKFTRSVDMARVEKDFSMFFSPVVQKSNFFYDPKNITVKEYSYTNFNHENRTVDLAFQFFDPFELGLNTEKSDYIMFFVN